MPLISYDAGPASYDVTSSPTPSPSNMSLSSCSSLCSSFGSFNNWDVTPLTCTQVSANTTPNTPIGQSSVGCAVNFTAPVDFCQVTLNVKTSGTAETYMEVWLPTGDAGWNGRTMNTDNGGLNGCVHYVDMTYLLGMGFATIGDNAGHNGSAFDGSWLLNNNEAIVDWAYRARHASVDVGKQVVKKAYKKNIDYSYYIGCSTGGAQGMQSAQRYPDDFDGIISGATAADVNNLQSWNSRFYQITGLPGSDSFLTLDQWILVQKYILEQCEPLDGVYDGIIEDPTICNFDVSKVPVCDASAPIDSNSCLHSTQVETVKRVFSALNQDGKLLYPPLLYGAQVDAFRLGQLSGSIQGIARDWFSRAVHNVSDYPYSQIGPSDYALANSLDELHGKPSAFDPDLSEFKKAGKKLLMYHGLTDPLVSGYTSQRYYQKVAKTMSLEPKEIDDFFRLFRISGMAHCSVGGVSGAGAWMFGQNKLASPGSNNIVKNLMDWVEKGSAPDRLLGTKFRYDVASLGIEFERAHCRYPYRTTYIGGGADATKPDSWKCVFIDNWQKCEGVTCNSDGSF